MNKFFLFLFFFSTYLSANEKKQDIPTYSCVVLGGGVGALTSALYLARAGIAPLVIEGHLPGGLISQSHSVQNWPGEWEISGEDLVDRMRNQAEKNGAFLLSEEVVAVDFSQRPFHIKIRDIYGKQKERVVAAHTCIIAMGTTPNSLGVRGEDLYWGRGITNCATCDGPLYKNKEVVIIGGGDTAILEAQYLCKIAKKVTIVLRGSTFRAQDELRKQEILAKPNVEVLYNNIVEEIIGDSLSVSTILTRSPNKARLERIAVDGIFLAIGSVPNSKIFHDQLEVDERGYIILKNDQETSIEGVYAIGDITDPIYKQAISAAGDGAKAAIQAQRYLEKNSLDSTTMMEEIEKEYFIESILEISSVEQFYSELSKSSLPVIIDFYATWCGACSRLYPIYESEAASLTAKARFMKVNIDKARSLFEKYAIQAMPTVLLIHPNGTVLDRRIGISEITSLFEEMKKADYGEKIR